MFVHDTWEQPALSQGRIHDCCIEINSYYVVRELCCTIVENKRELNSDPDRGQPVCAINKKIE
jgi:hypothetical protein